MNSRELMSTPPRTCELDTDLGTIAQMMWDHDFGFVPVTDESGNLIGVITDRDICIATATRHQAPGRIAAREAMTSPVKVCMADDTIAKVLTVMKDSQVRRLPVVDDEGRLQGVISMNDIALASNQKQRPAAKDIVSTLAAICAHRTLAESATSGERV
jgi:CBS domain-containing protein